MFGKTRTLERLDTNKPILLSISFSNALYLPSISKKKCLIFCPLFLSFCPLWIIGHYARDLIRPAGPSPSSPLGLKGPVLPHAQQQGPALPPISSFEDLGRGSEQDWGWYSETFAYIPASGFLLFFCSAFSCQNLVSNWQFSQLSGYLNQNRKIQHLSSTALPGPGGRGFPPGTLPAQDRCPSCPLPDSRGRGYLGNHKSSSLQLPMWAE